VRVIDAELKEAETVLIGVSTMTQAERAIRQHRTRSDRMFVGSRLATLVVVGCTIAVLAADVGGGTTSQQSFKVTSTLDGKKVLPLRMHWRASAKLPTAQISQVDFLIDGKVRWIEHNAPYVYGSDDNGRNQGFLITTWLAPGIHRFTVRVSATKGRVSHTIKARVQPAPQPPAELAGKWQRNAPEGVWELIFDRVGEWHLDPMGSGLVNQFDVKGTTLHVYAPIQMAPLINDRTTITRDGHHNIGGFDCNSSGPFGTYQWAVSGQELTLTPITEPCRDRRGILRGKWTRVK
jgi:hypothetical protein